MTIHFESRPSESPYLEMVTRGWTEGQGSAVRPAENCWHMVIVRTESVVRPLVVGPWQSSGVVSYGDGAELLWVRFSIGSWMPHLPGTSLLERETPLPEALRDSFWLKGAAWQIPDFDNVETFVERLARQEILVREPLVSAVLTGEPHDWAERTVRHRFRRATGLNPNQILQVERAQRAAEMLRRGVPILDTVFDLGYADQPHLTRSLKRFIGSTPGQLYVPPAR